MTRLAVRAGILPQGSLQRMDAAIAALAAYVARVAHTNPPWSRIDAELLVADQYLARAGEVPEAFEPAERGLARARQGAPETIAKCARRVVVAALRSGAAERVDPLLQVDTLLEEAAQAAEAHHLSGEAAHIAGLRVWRTAQQGRAVDVAEKAMEQAINRAGSVIVKVSVLLHTGRGTGRRDLVARARRLARTLPCPVLEGECLEALGLMDAARERYLAAGLRLHAMALERDPTPPPIGA